MASRNLRSHFLLIAPPPKKKRIRVDSSQILPPPFATSEFKKESAEVLANPLLTEAVHLLDGVPSQKVLRKCPTLSHPRKLFRKTLSALFQISSSGFISKKDLNFVQRIPQ